MDVGFQLNHIKPCMFCVSLYFLLLFFLPIIILFSGFSQQISIRAQFIKPGMTTKFETKKFDEEIILFMAC